MGLPKGRTNNPSGRKRGIPNKVGRDAKQLIADFFTEKMAEMWTIWPKLTPREKSNLMVGLAPYVAAKLATVAVSAELNFKEMPEEALDSICERLINNTRHEK